MKRIAFLSSLSPFGKLLLLLGIILVLAITTALIGLVAGMLIFNVQITELSNFVANPDTPEAISFLKFYQVTNQFGVFILPTLFFTYLVSNSPTNYLSLNKVPKLLSILIGGLIIYTILPFNNFLDEINRNMNLPDFLSGMEEWIKEKEEQARHLTEIFLKSNSITGLLINIFVVALIPAIGEELIFRGLLLKLLKDLFKNIHIAVILSAVVFSAIHLQFYGFLPRLMLGIILGYLFVFTGNLWVPIFVHFLNNASSAIVFYLHDNGYIKISMEEFGSSQNVAYIIGSLLITLWLLTILYQKEGADRIIKNDQ